MLDVGRPRRIYGASDPTRGRPVTRRLALLSCTAALFTSLAFGAQGAQGATAYPARPAVQVPPGTRISEPSPSR
jgi:hypothetical protein